MNFSFKKSLFLLGAIIVAVPAVSIASGGIAGSASATVGSTIKLPAATVTVTCPMTMPISSPAWYSVGSMCGYRYITGSISGFNFSTVATGGLYQLQYNSSCPTVLPVPPYKQFSLPFIQAFTNNPGGVGGTGNLNCEYGVYPAGPPAPWIQTAVYFTSNSAIGSGPYSSVSHCSVSGNVFTCH